MRHRSRRSFLTLAGLAAGTALFDVNRSGPFGPFAQEPAPPSFPDEILNPIEVSGEEAVPIIGRLPGAAPDVRAANITQGEHHLIGQPGDVARCAAGRNRRRARDHDVRGPHRRGDAAARTSQQPCGAARAGRRGGDRGERPCVAHDARRLRQPSARDAAWVDDAIGSRADRALHDERPRGCRVCGHGRSALIVGRPGRQRRRFPPGKLAQASFAGRFPARAGGRPRRPEPARVTNLVLPSTPGAYVLADGGGERFGGNTFLARNANTTGQFLFIITEGGGGGGVGAHFHARHFENFFALDGETLGWANGKAALAQDRRLLPGAAAPPARLPAHAGVQPVRGLPHAWHLRDLLHARR